MGSNNIDLEFKPNAKSKDEYSGIWGATFRTEKIKKRNENAESVNKLQNLLEDNLQRNFILAYFPAFKMGKNDVNPAIDHEIWTSTSVELYEGKEEINSVPGIDATYLRDIEVIEDIADGVWDRYSVELRGSSDFTHIESDTTWHDLRGVLEEQIKQLELRFPTILFESSSGNRFERITYRNGNVDVGSYRNIFAEEKNGVYSLDYFQELASTVEPEPHRQLPFDHDRAEVYSSLSKDEEKTKDLKNTVKQKADDLNYKDEIF